MSGPKDCFWPCMAQFQGIDGAVVRHLPWCLRTEWKAQNNQSSRELDFFFVVRGGVKTVSTRDVYKTLVNSGR